MCPVCEKKYMTYVYKEDDYEYRCKKINKWVYGWKDICPKCNTHLFVEDGELAGVVMDNIPEKDIKHIGAWNLRR